MKTVELIEILIQDNGKVGILKSPLIRFLTWTFYSVLSIFFILAVFTMITGKYNIPRSLESLSGLVAALLVCGFVLFKRNIPGDHRSYDYFFYNLILISWFGFLIVSVSETEKGLFSSLMENWQTHGPGCAELILLLTMVPSVLLISYLRKGFMEPSALFWFSCIVLPYVLAQATIPFFCPNETPAHILSWHALASIPFYCLIFFVAFKLTRIKISD
ncbi:hypothetical protein [Leptospira sp. 'Mane']|uniref:hypothetical protein n=1 Tax=Leptospira sp. 'Mane' TaxID=3387407 RepID=UPI00398AAD8D